MESSRITNIQPSMYYIPNFITEEEESNVLSKVRVPYLPTPYPHFTNNTSDPTNSLDLPFP
ncbi:hypothetical protein Slin15195_G020300 [Septoria linicola]|uniref:Uncharacterized protein n=1 Tax=Septoria linicola TaxID=215465 RepID=A0A9Q9AMK8_9PEZI|nr:hypothetical protein Slin14017_G020370 [Septoria linicola]USW48711.1 hypothetical protein Slin15195_G020300 [Septoria linicola]